MGSKPSATIVLGMFWEAAAVVTSDVPVGWRQEAQYCLDVCGTTNGAHIEKYSSCSLI
jgi:hypothetical protein